MGSCSLRPVPPVIVNPGNTTRINRQSTAWGVLLPDEVFVRVGEVVYLQTERDKWLVMDEEHSRIPQAHLVCTPNRGVRLGKAHRRAPGTPYDTDQGYSERYNRWGKHRQPWKLATAENQEANQNQWTIRYPRTLISLPPLWGKNGKGPSMPSSHRTPRNGQGSVTSSLRPQSL